MRLTGWRRTITARLAYYRYLGIEQQPINTFGNFPHLWGIQAFGAVQWPCMITLVRNHVEQKKTTGEKEGTGRGFTSSPLQIPPILSGSRALVIQSGALPELALLSVRPARMRPQPMSLPPMHISGLTISAMVLKKSAIEPRKRHRHQDGVPYGSVMRRGPRCRCAARQDHV